DAEHLSHLARRFAGGELERDAAVAMGERGGPSREVDPAGSEFRRRTAFVLDEDFAPFLVLLVPRVDALDVHALAALAVTGADIVDVQRAADMSTIADLRHRVLDEAAPRGGFGPPLLNQPGECLAGVADGLLNGFATPFT